MFFNKLWSDPEIDIISGQRPAQKVLGLFDRGSFSRYGTILPLDTGTS